MNSINDKILYSTFDEIDSLIGVAEENNFLEFKRGAVFDSIDQEMKAEIVRDVSGFANAGGGTIIYGIAESDGAKSMAKAISPVKNSKVTQLQLTQIIRSGLDPVFNEFDVHCIDVPEGGRIVVITIERADTAHQCKADHKYYHRVGPQRIAMFDYEIRDVMNRRTAPIIRIEFDKRRIVATEDIHTYELKPTLVNEGNLTARHWSLE
jgi:predicted HTH transcriptional regulator